MFARKIRVEYEDADRTLPCPLKWLDSFSMRSFTNYSVFDVDSVQELHDLLMQLPLFPYMAIEIDAMCRHPSSIRDDDR